MRQFRDLGPGRENTRWSGSQVEDQVARRNEKMSLPLNPLLTNTEAVVLISLLTARFLADVETLHVHLMKVWLLVHLPRVVQRWSLASCRTMQAQTQLPGNTPGKGSHLTKSGQFGEAAFFWKLVLSHKSTSFTAYKINQPLNEVQRTFLSLLPPLYLSISLIKSNWKFFWVVP